MITNLDQQENINNQIHFEPSSLSEAVNKLSKDIFIIEGLAENCRKTNESININAYLLSNYGWYVSANMMTDSVFKIFEAIKNKNIDVAEEILLRYYRKNISKIKDFLIEEFPDRKLLIIEAFKAHKQKMYFSFTILFLSQADGICFGKIFRGKKVVENYLNDKKHYNIINAVLRKETAINADTRKKDKSDYSSDLNRHGVMHGLSLDYGNEKNSLKAFSLLCFISDFIRH